MSSPAHGQVPDLDSLRRAHRAAADQYRSDEAAAARVFFDRTHPTADRLAAVRDFATFVDAQRVSAGIRVALDNTEPAPVRIKALQLVAYHAREDTVFAKQLFAIATDTGPAEVRSNAITQIALIAFEPLEPQPEFFRTLRSAASDRDVGVRRTALATLAAFGDSAGLRMLADGLTSPNRALLPPSEAVRLLGLKDPRPYYPTFHKLMVQPPDTATRLAAILLVGGYGPSRPVLERYLADPRETPAIREAALGALSSGDREGFPKRALTVVRDETAPEELRLRAIKSVEIMRTSRDPKVYARNPDDFDRVVQQLADSSSKPRIREAARTYLSRTRSPK